jgi:hypothetical protein
MKLAKVLLAVIVGVLCVVPHANAQTVQVAGIGSSALFLELGQAAALSATINTPCTWTGAKGLINAIDARGTLNDTEKGQVWVTWNAGTGTCAAPAGTFNVYFYIQTDSVVGNRCTFAVPSCTLSVTPAATTTPGANLLNVSITSPLTVTDTTYLPQSVATALSGFSINTAGTDIRPEDAKFATVRALTNCGSPVNGVTGSQYLGLGYATAPGSPYGNSIVESTTGVITSPASFVVADFNLIGTDPITNGAVSSYSVYDVGAVPIVVFVNPSDSAGLGSILVSNVSRGVLAGFLDGTYGRAADFVSQSYVAATGISKIATTTYIREPLSGTYNTMEYGIPNNTELQTSQDVGLNQPAAAQNCSGVVVAANPLSGATAGGSKIKRTGVTGTYSYRYRAIGTGDEVKQVLGTTDSLGYSFWGTANFANALASTGKYLQVDGIDPLQQVWTDGLIPTAGNGLLGDVSFANVKNGSYPIWSKLRLAATSAGQTGAAALATAAQNYISPSQPDFVPTSQLLIVRSHFAPPFNANLSTTNPGYADFYNVNFLSSGTNQPANGTAGCNAGSTPEAGGDVGGLVYTLQSDGDFCQDYATTYGQIGRRQ